MVNAGKLLALDLVAFRSILRVNLRKNDIAYLVDTLSEKCTGFPKLENSTVNSGLLTRNYTVDNTDFPSDSEDFRAVPFLRSDERPRRYVGRLAVTAESNLQICLAFNVKITLVKIETCLY